MNKKRLRWGIIIVMLFGVLMLSALYLLDKLKIVNYRYFTPVTDDPIEYCSEYRDNKKNIQEILAIPNEDEWVYIKIDELYYKTYIRNNCHFKTGDTIAFFDKHLPDDGIDYFYHDAYMIMPKKMSSEEFKRCKRKFKKQYLLNISIWGVKISPHTKYSFTLERKKVRGKHQVIKNTDSVQPIKREGVLPPS